MAKVLIVEDNELNLDMLSQRLVRKGFEVVAARDGLTGVELARQAKPDLILMDIGLPDIDGWEATSRIKADPETRSLPIIALTANALPAERQHCLEAGMDDYLAKPIRVTDLQSMLARWAGGV